MARHLQLDLISRQATRAAMVGLSHNYRMFKCLIRPDMILGHLQRTRAWLQAVP